MNPYRGKLLATAVLFAALPLFGCGDADKWEQTTEITLSAPAPEGLNEVVFTVVSPPPAEGYACETLLEYRAQGAGVDIDWRNIPGTETTRLFEVRPRAEGIMSVMARGMCEGSKEDWKYSNRVDVTVTEAAASTVSSVTLTASPTSVEKTKEVTFNLQATKATDCTLRLKYSYYGTGFPGIFTVDPAAPGLFKLTPMEAGTLSVTAVGWCAENPTAQVTTTTNVTVLPTMASISLVASPTTVELGPADIVSYTLAATGGAGCTVRLKYEYSGAGFSASTVNSASPGLFTLDPSAVGSLVAVATGWCSENPTATVTATATVTVNPTPTPPPAP